MKSFEGPHRTNVFVFQFNFSDVKKYIFFDSIQDLSFKELKDGLELIEYKNSTIFNAVRHPTNEIIYKILMEREQEFEFQVNEMFCFFLPKDNATNATIV